MREEFQNILNEYQEAYGQSYAKHPLGEMLRKTIPNAINQLLSEPERYIIRGSAGSGNWTALPWIAILDRLITLSPQFGYYPVFLFKKDMSGFYLSLNQGVTDIERKYKRDAKDVLKFKVEDFRAQLGDLPVNFKITEIHLDLPNAKSRYGSLYEAGNIFAKYYSSQNLPSDSQLKIDILDILKIYETLSYNEGLPTTEAEKENDEENFKGIEDLKKFRFHKRIERNTYLSQKVKRTQGYTCKACLMNFTDIYGELGKEFIEAHHLKPIFRLTGSRIELDIRHDFTVLCSNCHSMIHRLDDPSDLGLLKTIIKTNRKL